MVEAVVRQHLESPAMWSIFQLQDLLGIDGRSAARMWTPSASMCGHPELLLRTGCI